MDGPTGSSAVRAIARLAADGAGRAASARSPSSRISDRDELEQDFRQLTPEHRAVLVLHFFVGLPVTEIAETLGIPAGTAGSRLHYAVRCLRAAHEADARNVVAWRHPA
jgi:RNA polymerase sigma-70 factor (ECF subfamily)